MRIFHVVVSISLISLLAACASKDTMIPVPDKDMETVYNQHMQTVGEGKLNDVRSVLRRPMEQEDIDLSDYVRTEKNQLEAKFKRIPNPTLYMFVSPHLAASTEVPIPGYITEFKMWEKENYAMPGEISDMQNTYGDQ